MLTASQDLGVVLGDGAGLGLALGVGVVSVRWVFQRCTNASSGSPSLSPRMTFSVRVPEADRGQAVLGDQRVVAAEQQPVRAAVEAEAGRRGLDRVRRQRGRVDGLGDRAEQIEIGLQLRRDPWGRRPRPVECRRCSGRPGGRPARRSAMAPSRRAGQHGPGVPGIAGPHLQVRDQDQRPAAVRRTAAPRRRRRDPAGRSAAAGWPTAGRIAGRPPCWCTRRPGTAPPLPWCRRRPRRRLGRSPCRTAVRGGPAPSPAAGLESKVQPRRRRSST